MDKLDKIFKWTKIANIAFLLLPFVTIPLSMLLLGTNLEKYVVYIWISTLRPNIIIFPLCFISIICLFFIRLLKKNKTELEKRSLRSISHYLLFLITLIIFIMLFCFLVKDID